MLYSLRAYLVRFWQALNGPADRGIDPEFDPLLYLFAFVALTWPLVAGCNYAHAESVPEPPAVTVSAPVPTRQAEPLPQSGCIVMDGRCSCVVDGRLRPGESCPAPVRPISLSGMFSHAEPPARHLPFPDLGPALLPKSEPVRLGRFWLN